MNLGMPIFKLEGQGEVKRAQESEKPVKREFDVNTIGNGLEDSAKEGGTSIARSTGESGMSNARRPGEGVGFNGGGGGPFELSGFSVRYDVPGTKDVASVEVSVSFGSMESAQGAIKGNQYVHITPNAFVILCDIIKGAPVICVNDIEKCKYVEGAWVRC